MFLETGLMGYLTNSISFLLFVYSIDRNQRGIVNILELHLVKKEVHTSGHPPYQLRLLFFCLHCVEGRVLAVSIWRFEGAGCPT